MKVMSGALEVGESGDWGWNLRPIPTEGELVERRQGQRRNLRIFPK